MGSAGPGPDLAVSVSENTVRAVARRYAGILARLGGEIGRRPLVLPTSEFFPDEFRRDAASVGKLVARMQRHAGISDIPVETQLLESTSGQPLAGQSCSSGACAAPIATSNPQRIVPTSDGWQLTILDTETSHPVALTTTIARALATIFLLDTLEDGARPPEPVDVSVDLTAVALGFGCLMLEGSYIYTKSCGGPGVHQTTRLALPELSVASALFVALGNHKHRRLTSELGTTQRATFKEAREWIDSNPELVAEFTRAPENVARGDFEVSHQRPLLSRLFKRKPREEELFERALAGELPGALPIAGARFDGSHTRSPQQAASTDDDDDLKAIVAEALESAHAERADAE